MSKTPITYRSPLCATSEVQEWEQYMPGSFDTAGKGKAALLAAAFKLKLIAKLKPKSWEPVLA